MTNDNNERLEIECTFNDNTGKLVLVADLNGAQLERIFKNVSRIEWGKPIDQNSIDLEEFVIQVSQKIIKSGPPGFDINQPDHVRNLSPKVWSQLKRFIGKHYSPMAFLLDSALLVFGENLLEQNSSQPTTSSTHVDVS